MGKIEAEFGTGQTLGLRNEILLVLKSRNPLQQRNDPVEATFDVLLVGQKRGVGRSIGQWMLRACTRQG